MKNRKSYLLLSLFFIFCSSAQAVEDLNNYTLEQVVVFSRHGLRAPLSSPDSTLGKVTPNQWPQMDTPASYLTGSRWCIRNVFWALF